MIMTPYWVSILPMRECMIRLWEGCSALSQIAGGNGFSARKAWGAAANGAIVGAGRHTMINRDTLRRARYTRISRTEYMEEYFRVQSLSNNNGYLQNGDE